MSNTVIFYQVKTESAGENDARNVSAEPLEIGRNVIKFGEAEVPITISPDNRLTIHLAEATGDLREAYIENLEGDQATLAKRRGMTDVTFDGTDPLVTGWAILSLFAGKDRLSIEPHIETSLPSRMKELR